MDYEHNVSIVNEDEMGEEPDMDDTDEPLVDEEETDTEDEEL